MDLTIDEALKKGIDAHKAGNLHEAQRYYTAILKAQPQHPDANHNLGTLAMSIGKEKEALPFFKIALEANPKIAYFWVSFIDCLIKLGRLSFAKKVLEHARNQGASGQSFDELEQKLNAISDFSDKSQVPDD